MLAHRIIPTLLYRGATLVKGCRFAGDRSVGHVQQAARIYAARGVDELVILDIDATPAGRGPDLDLVRRITDGNFTPVAVGGGVRNQIDARDLLTAGADKVVVRTLLDTDPAMVMTMAMRFGSQAVVAAIDYQEGQKAVGRCLEAEQLGVGEIMLTCMSREGTQAGYDLATIERCATVLGIPLIAHGGCSGYDDMHRAIQAGANAVAAGALFQFTDCTPAGAAKYLAAKGIEVRT